jgi:hypothetical protein
MMTNEQDSEPTADEMYAATLPRVGAEPIRRGVVVYEISGTYRPCPACRAPIVDPFPSTWRLSGRKEDDRTYLTPHRDTCTYIP